MKKMFKKAYVSGFFDIADGIYDVEVSQNGISCGNFYGDSVSSCGDQPFFSPFNYIIVPGLVDVHVHLREPGFSYKETIQSGTEAAARGGYTAVCSMPNLNPVPDGVENLEKQLEIIRKDALINVFPYGSISVGEKGKQLSDMKGMASDVIAFSDDGKGIQSREMMREAMIIARDLGKIIVAHCEDESLLNGGYIHDGEYASKNGHRGICSESEWRPVARDIELAAETGCAYHVCHISAKETVDIIREAKRSGVNVSCETAPHYLVLDDSMMSDDGRYKMNPPLRSPKDREALIEGVLDGTVDMIATDHAPHSAEEKSRGLEKSLMGISGIELAFPVVYTELVRKGILSLKRLTELMCTAPKTRFGMNMNMGVSVFDVSDKYRIESADLRSMGKCTPFDKREVYGRCVLTVCNGKTVWESK